MVFEARAYQVAGWVGVVILGICAVLAGVMEKWWGLAGLAALLSLAVAFLMLPSRLPSLFSMLFVAAAVLNGLGWVFNFWDRVPYYDPFTHAFTTFSGTLAVGYLVYGSVTLHVGRYATLLFALNVAALGMAVGGLWEIFEWSIGVPQTYQSVAVDLIADAIGALGAAMLAMYVFRTTGPSPAKQPRHPDQ
ncbi:MAG: hypothetical protein WD294_09345 [Phycisphaeraceae bacterium]